LEGKKQAGGNKQGDQTKKGKNLKERGHMVQKITKGGGRNWKKEKEKGDNLREMLGNSTRERDDTKEKDKKKGKLDHLSNKGSEKRQNEQTSVTITGEKKKALRGRIPSGETWGQMRKQKGKKMGC